MPLFDFACNACGHTQERLFSTFDAMQNQQVLCARCNSITTRLVSAPGSVVVTGFSSMNGYASARHITTHHGNGTRTEVRGNLEAFSDGLHK
jgi:putative FmdB family regulatory protein